jgi:hypothetical protein
MKEHDLDGTCSTYRGDENTLREETTGRPKYRR